jgi:hypothetical protein
MLAAGMAQQAAGAMAPEQLGKLIADALGHQDGPDLTALLDALPHGKDVAIAQIETNAPASGVDNPHFASGESNPNFASGDSGHFAAAMGATHGFDMAMVAHEAMVVAHG